MTLNLKTISPLVITILISICSSAQPSAPCKRLLISGLENSAIFPWIQMSGLYHLYDVPNATFPLYKHDLQDMFFYHNTTAKRFEIKPAEWISKGWPPVLGALTSGSYISTSPTTPFYPFRYMIDKWFQYNPAEASYVTHNAYTIQPMCVSDDVQTCFGGKIVFNQNLTQVRSVVCTIHVFHVISAQFVGGWGLTIPVWISKPLVLTNLLSDLVANLILTPILVSSKNRTLHGFMIYLKDVPGIADTNN